MKKRIRLKGRIRTYIQFTLYLGLLLLAIDAAVFMLDFRAGLLTFGFTIFYFAITLTLYFYNKPIIMNELISFATEYGQIQAKTAAGSGIAIRPSGRFRQGDLDQHCL